MKFFRRENKVVLKVDAESVYDKTSKNYDNRISRVTVHDGTMFCPKRGRRVKTFNVTFEQDGKIIKPRGHIITLQKREFAINVAFLGYQGEQAAVRLHTSKNDNYYKIASKGMPVSDLLTPGIGMAEPAAAQKNLILSDANAVQYLFINAKGSRFQQVKKGNKAISGKRNVDEFTFRGGKSFPVANLGANELYLVFIKRSVTGIQQEYYLIQFANPNSTKKHG